MQRFVFAILLLMPLGLIAQAAQSSQTPPAQSESPYANYSIMLVPTPAGEAVVMMYNPQGQLEFVPVNSTKKAFEGGYVPVRAAEISKLIESLNAENKRLEGENAALRSSAAQQPSESTIHVITDPGQEQTALQREAMARAELQQRRQQLLQMWLGMQNANKPYILPQPPQRPAVNCTTRTVGGTTYTNCN